MALAGYSGEIILAMFLHRINFLFNKLLILDFRSENVLVKYSSERSRFKTRVQFCVKKQKQIAIISCLRNSDGNDS